jgi:hypothetical protein
VSGLRRWAVASNERAVANARVAATECSRARVERAEVELYLRGFGEPDVEATTGAAATAR